VFKGRFVLAGLLLAAIVAGIAAAAPRSPKTAKLTPLKFAYAPITDYAPIFVGLKLGYFKQQGIDLKTTNTSITPASLVAASLSGQVDIATNSATATITAISQGIPCKLLAAASTTPTKGNTEILVSKGSPIKRFRDLAGKTVATVALQGFFHLITLNAVEKDGGDWTKVTALPIAQPDELNALNAGRVDAIVLQDPFDTLAKLQGVRSIGNPLALFDPAATAGVVIGCGNVLDQKADLLRHFLAAWKKSVNYAQAHPKFTRSLLPKYTTLTPEAASLITLPNFTTTLAPAVLGKYLKAMIHYGWIKGTPPSYSQLVWSEK